MVGEYIPGAFREFSVFSPRRGVSVRNSVPAVLCCAVWLGLASLCSGAPALSLPDPRIVEIARDQAVREVNAQTAMPQSEEMTVTAKKKKMPSGEGKIDIDIVTLSRWLLWGAIIVIVAVVLFHLRDNLWSFSRVRDVRGKRSPEQAPEAAAAAAARMEKAGGEADALAGEGRYAEAIHILLLQTLEELRRRSEVGFAASLTSRELLHSLEMPPEQRHLFGAIISRVEVSWFGPHDPDGEEYAVCRRDFERLKGLIRAGGAA